MWKLTNAPKTQKVTTTLAKQFSELDGIRNDRVLSERRLTVYRRMVEHGGFRPVSWAKAWCEETKQWYRVNGQHTSTLFSSLKNEQLVNIYATVESYECDTLEDVAQLYSTFDSQQQSRNAADINRAFASTIPEFSEWLNDSRFLNLIVSGLAYYLDPGNTLSKTAATYRTQAERAEVLFDNIPVCIWVREILFAERANSQKMYRVPIVAAMIGSWHKNRQDASLFWTEVRDETGPSPDLPSRKLAKLLLTTKSHRIAARIAAYHSGSVSRPANTTANPFGRGTHGVRRNRPTSSTASRTRSPRLSSG